MKRTIGILGAVWGIAGVTVILAMAVVRVYKHADVALQMELSALQWVAAVVWCLFMLVAEGYRGFQKQFSPRVVARARYLARHPRLIDVVLAPLFCIGYFHATRRRKIASWALTLGIVLLVLAVHRLPQPWRGIIDLGVVLGLAYGLLWVYVYVFRALIGRPYEVDPEVR